jgi:hypothetical protein
LLKALSERLKKDRAEREAAKEFEISDTSLLPATMHVMEPRTFLADKAEEADLQNGKREE